MDADPPLPDGRGADDPKPRPGGFGRYLRRLRSALRFGRPSGTSRRSANNNNPGHVPLLSPSRQQPATIEPIRQALETRTSPAPHTEPRDAQTFSKFSFSTSPQYAHQGPFDVEKTRADSAADVSTTSLTRSDSIRLPGEDHRIKRAAELFERYGVDIDPDVCTYGDRPVTAGNLQRVEKSVRVRVHHHCHHCSLAIGPTGICVNCGHKLCKKCYRYPESKDAKPLDVKGRKRKAPSPTRSETLESWLSPKSSTLALRPAATREPNFDKISVTRRVRRLCHQCMSPFIWNDRVCQDCEHEMCRKCPLDPPPIPDDGDPNPGSASASPSSQLQRQSFLQRDRIFKRPRLRVRYTCDKCGSLLQERTDFCSKCGHLRCGACHRSPPHRQPEAEPDPEILASLQRRLAAFNMPTSSFTTQQSASPILTF